MIQWLWSIEADRLDGPGLAITLTVGTTPATSDDWGAIRDRFLQWLRDNGATRHHWLTEWTRRGRPHLHLCVYGIPTDDTTRVKLALAWINLARSAGLEAGFKGQHPEPIRDATGWLKYVAMHSARGVDHYQRTTPPEGWTKTGRLWGKGGDWPTAEAMSIRLTATQTWRYIALLRNWQATRMRREGVPEDVVREYLAREPGKLQGVSGWIPERDSVMLLLLATERPDEADLLREIET